MHFRHDNLVEMLGFIETNDKSVLGESQRHYHVVSELLVGVSLDKLLEGKLTDQQGHYVPFAEKLFKDYKQDPAHFARTIVKSILSGLMTMHDAGYIHRDIDPSNIMVTSDGHIKLIDFGIAKKFNMLTAGDKNLTLAGIFIGKPEYAAPELVLGAINQQNQTTDIYAIGILLFQCIVGHPPFEGDRAEILQKQLHSKLPLKLIKNRELRKIIKKATEKTRYNRYQSVAEFRVALDNQVPPSNPIWKYAAVSVAAVASVVIGYFLMQNPRDGSIGPNPPTPIGITYNSAVNDLKHAATAANGLDALTKLEQKGNPDATFLLSRLYFESKREGDFCPDSIRKMKKVLNLQTDNKKAHELLKKAVERDPSNYQAHYELACDYFYVGLRIDSTVVKKKRDAESAETEFEIARKYAEKAHDTLYLKMIDEKLARVEELYENRRIKSELKKAKAKMSEQYGATY